MNTFHSGLLPSEHLLCENGIGKDLRVSLRLALDYGESYAGDCFLVESFSLG
jgi:hypothetical protein